MAFVQLAFSRRHHVGSLALRAFLWSKWSHCVIVDDDVVIEANATDGVVERPYLEFAKNTSKIELIKVPVPSEAVKEAVLAAARSQVGKEYDWIGLLGLGLRNERLSSRRRWFCSELIAWAFDQAGYPLLRIKPWRVSPQHLYIPYWHRCESAEGMENEEPVEEVPVVSGGSNTRPRVNDGIYQQQVR